MPLAPAPIVTIRTCRAVPRGVSDTVYFSVGDSMMIMDLFYQSGGFSVSKKKWRITKKYKEND